MMQDARIRSLCQQATLCLNITQDDFKLSGVQNGKNYICTPALEIWDRELIAEIDETIGAAYIIEEAMHDGTVTFTY